MVFRWQANDGPLILDPPPPPTKTFWLGNHVFRYKIVRLHLHKNRDLLFLPRTLVGKDEHVHPTLLALWKYHARIQEFSPGGRAVRKKNSDNVFRHQLFYSFTEGYQWFILRKTIFFKVPEGIQYFTGEGVHFFPGGGGANLNIELVNFQGGGGLRSSGFTHAYDRSTCFFSEANPERQVFSCNGLFFIAQRLVTLQNTIRYMILDILSGSTLYKDFI